MRISSLLLLIGHPLISSFELIDLSVKPSHSSSSIDCNFSLSSCGWSSNEPWLLTDSILLPCPVHGLPRRLPSSGSFMGAQGRFGSDKEGNLTSGWFEGLSRGGILTFKYSKQTDLTRLDVYLREGEDYHLLDSITSIGLLPWNERQAIVPSGVHESQIIFRVENIQSAFDVVGVDDIRLRELEEGELSKRSLFIGNKNKPINNFGRSIISPIRKTDVRRAPVSSPLSKTIEEPSCPAIKCDFSRDYCSWIPSGRFKITNKKLITEGKGETSLISEPVTLPAIANIIFEIFTSDSTIVSVIARSPSGEDNLVWTNGGIYLSGWNKIRMPIRYSPHPTTIIIRSTISNDGFVALSHINLIDELGKDAYCGQSISMIRPNRASDISMTRLTAIQSIDSLDQSEISGSTIPLPLSPLPLTPPPLSSQSLLSSSLSFIPLTPSFISSPSISSLPISPSIVHSSSSLLQSNPFLLPLSNSITPDAPIHSYTGEPRIRIDDRTIPPMKSLKTTTQSSITTPSPLSSIISGIGGQPILEAQLKQLAKKFGFDNIHGERAQAALAAAKRIFGESGVNKFIEKNTKSFNPPSGIRPIFPVNAPSEGGESIHNEEVALFKNVPNLHSDFAQKINDLVDLPEHVGSRPNPLAKNNVDFIVQNAMKGVKEQFYSFH